MPSAISSLTVAAEAFVRDMVGALAKLQTHEPQHTAYIERLLKEMGASPPTFNGHPESACEVPAAWQDIGSIGRKSRVAPLLESLIAIECAFDWMDGQRFWPNQRHRYFSQKLWSTYLIGDQEAPFSAQNRYIALLMIMGPDMVYPLHSHRIEELYFIVSGHGDWSHNGEDWTALPPESTFFNSSWQPHAIRANDAPIITIGFYLPPYGWEGGLLHQSD